MVRSCTQRSLSPPSSHLPLLALEWVVLCAGVVLAAEKRITSKLLDIRKLTEKMYKIDDHVA
jgi:hypothetical protein